MNGCVDIYPWDAARGAWAQQPAATGERPVYVSDNGTATAANMLLYVIVPPDASSAVNDRLLSALGPGRYLLKYYVDTTGKLEQDYTIPTNTAAFFQGQQEVSAAWNAGASWGAPVQVRFAAASAAP